jgi:hypothetical protein
MPLTKAIVFFLLFRCESTQGHSTETLWVRSTLQRIETKIDKLQLLRDGIREPSTKEGAVSKLEEDGVALRAPPEKALPAYFMSLGNDDSSCNEAYPLVSLKRRLAFCGAPKAGTTLWRSFLNKLEGYEGEGCCDANQPLRLFDVYAKKNGAAPGSEKVKWAIEHNWSKLFRILQVRNPIKRIFSAAIFLAEDVMPGLVPPEALEVGPSKNVKVFHNFICQSMIRGKIMLEDNPSVRIDMSVCKGDNPGNTDVIWQHFFPQNCRCGLEQGVQYDMVAKLEEYPGVVHQLRAKGVLREEDEEQFARQINTQKKVNNMFSYFSLPLFDALCKVRAQEIKELGYTQEVYKLRNELVTYQMKHKALFKGVERYFTMNSNCSHIS